MTEHEALQGIPGILRPSKEYFHGLGQKEGDQIVYYACVGACTPFVELLAVPYAGSGSNSSLCRCSMSPKQKSSTMSMKWGCSERESSKTQSESACGHGQACDAQRAGECGQVNQIVAQHRHAKVIGVCFMNLFEKAGWLKIVQFDLMIDATIDPVRVMKKTA